MRKEKFTPGPWRMTTSDDNGARVEGPTVIAWCGANGTYGAVSYTITKLEAKANARLIAAAPDLYDALDGLINVISETRGTPAYNAAKDALKALSKARGEHGFVSESAQLTAQGDTDASN